MLVVDAPSSGLYRDMAVIAKRKLPLPSFITYPRKSKHGSRSSFTWTPLSPANFMTDIADEQSIMRILMILLRFTTFWSRSIWTWLVSIKLIFSAPQPEFYSFPSYLDLQSLWGTDQDRYVFIYQNKEKDILSPTDHRQHVYVRMAVVSEYQNQSTMVSLLFFSGWLDYGWMSGCFLTEKCFRTGVKIFDLHIFSPIFFFHIFIKYLLRRGKNAVWQTSE